MRKKALSLVRRQNRSAEQGGKGGRFLAFYASAICNSSKRSTGFHHLFNCALFFKR